MNSSSVQGIIHIPILIAIALIGAVGAISATQLPSYIEEVKQTQVQNELIRNTIPEGTAAANELLVGFKENISVSKKDTAHQKVAARTKKRISKINTDLVEVPGGGAVNEIIAEYRKQPEVEYVEPNFVASVFMTPNDPFFPNQWNLKKISAETSYDFFRSASAIIAVVDTGIDANHPDLKGHVLTGYNTITESTNSHDDNGHGTHVAGIAAAASNNATGVASVSFQANLLPIKVLDKDGVGNYSDVSEGIVYAADNNSRIVNISLGGSSDSQTLKRAVDYALSKGIVLVAAAGNSGSSQPMYPASYAGVLAVSASDKNDNLASFSNYGANIFISSPGVSILSSYPGANYTQFSGTSMAAPHLSGLLTLMISGNSELTNSQLVELVKNNTDKVGSYPYDSNGWNAYHGYGRMNSGKTLSAIATPPPADEPQSTPTPEPGSKKPIKKERTSKRFNFNLTGLIESVDTEVSKITVKVEGGTPGVMELISGNIVDVHFTRQTAVLAQSSHQEASTLAVGMQVKIAGDVVETRLEASEINILSSSGRSSSQQEQQLQDPSSTQTDTVQELTGEDGGNQLPLQAEPKPKPSRSRSVKGISTSYFSEQIRFFLERIFY